MAHTTVRDALLKAKGKVKWVADAWMTFDYGTDVKEAQATGACIMGALALACLPEGPLDLQDQLGIDDSDIAMYDMTYVNPEEISQLVQDTLGKDAWDTLAFIPGFNDNVLYDRLRNLFFEREGIAYEYLKNRAMAEGGSEAWDAVDNAENDFAQHIESDSVWDDIIEVLHHEYPSVLGLEVCILENCKDC